MKALAFNSKETLALSWMGGQLECGFCKRGSQASDVRSYDNVVSLGDFENCLAQYLADSRKKSKSASLILDGNILDSNTLTLPPGSKRVQDTYVKEKASRQEAQEGPIIWEAQKIAAAKSGQKAIFHSISQENLNELKKIFAKQGIILRRLYPFSAIVPNLDQIIETDDSLSGLIVARTGAALKLISLDEKGVLEFARDISLDASIDDHRISIELNRCVLFARQQFGTAIQKIALVGEKANSLEPAVRKTLSDDISIVATKASKGMWLNQAVERHEHNLAQEDMAKERNRSWNRAAILAACVALGFFAFSDAWETEREWATLQSDIARLRAQESDIKDSILDLSAKGEQAERLREMIAQSAKEARPPIESALLNWLSQSLNDELWITELETLWNPEQSKWEVKLVAQSDSSAIRARELVERLRSEMEKSPLKIRISNSNTAKTRKAQVKTAAKQVQTIVIEGEIHHG